MPFTSTDLAAVDAALASGELTVETNGKRVTYRTVAELQEARRTITAELASAAANAAGGTRRGAFRVTFATHRGD